MRTVILATLSLILLASCQADRTREAIARQLGQYPESRVQDVYKSFCQDNLGPGHLIPDPGQARAYLLSEIQAYRADLDSGLYSKPELRYDPVGDESNYVRVDLSVVLDSLIDADTLLDAFVRSANEGHVLTADEWKGKWAGVAKVLRRHFADIPDAAEDLSAIDSLISEGNLILHHSPAYEAAYNPHYRIVAKEIFENELKYRILQ